MWPTCAPDGQNDLPGSPKYSQDWPNAPPDLPKINTTTSKFPPYDLPIFRNMARSCAPLNSFKTGLRWLEMKNVFFMKKSSLTCKNQVKAHFLENLWKLEDQYRIIFHQALWPEEPREIRFFRKTSRHEVQDFPNKCLKRLWNGFRKLIRGHGDLHPARNCDPNPLATLPGSRNPNFRSKKGRKSGF